MAEIVSLYLHGLGRDELRTNERRILERNQRKGIKFEPAYIDWRSSETFQQLLSRITTQALSLLDNMNESGRLLLEGSSAGGSLAINALSRINDARVRAISHSGRLTVGRFSQNSWRNLEHCAHLGTSRASQSFYDSVVYCETVTAPALTQEDKRRVLITKPWADEVVPVSTMDMEGVPTVSVHMIGHSFGIGMGMLRLPNLLEA